MEKAKNNRLYEGFTLIELSIVLIVVGLAAAGVFVGRSLILQAQIKKQITQVESFDLAVNVFKGKYACLPGDCANAEAIGLGDGTGLDGNGNEQVDSLNEALFLWHHLSRAQLIPGNYEIAIPTPGAIPGINTPPLALPGRGVTSNSPGYGFNVLGGAWLAAQVVLPTVPGRSQTVTYKNWMLIATIDSNFPNIPGVYNASTSSQLDLKIDDGMPATGKVIAYNSQQAYDITTNSFTAGYSISTSSCIINNSTPAQAYNTENRNTTFDFRSQCAIIIKASF